MSHLNARRQFILCLFLAGITMAVELFSILDRWFLHVNPSIRSIALLLSWVSSLIFSMIVFRHRKLLPRIPELFTARNAIHRPPTTRMLRVLQICCKHSTYQELEQIWVEALEEHYEALGAGDMLKARFALWRGRCDLALAAVNILPSWLLQSLAKTFIPTL